MFQVSPDPATHIQKYMGAIDRTIAEEQARQKAYSETNTIARPGSTSSRRTDSASARQKKATVDTADAPPNPDPAVFEAAFVIDDSDDPSRASTPMPQASEKDALAESVTASNSTADDGAHEKNVKGNDGGAEKTGVTDAQALSEKAKTEAKPAVATSELTPEIKQKLRKLEKLEATYPELLRSYRVAHRRATAIEPFEKALRENTPLTSIGDPDALIEYLSQLNTRGDLVMDELRRVTAEKDELKKKHEQKEESLKNLQDELNALKEGKTAGATNEEETAKQAAYTDEPSETAPEKVKSPVASVMGLFSPRQKPQSPDESKKETGEDIFSFDDEIPQLQADLSSKSEEIQRLQSEVEDLKQELTVAKENSAGLAESLEKATNELGEARGNSSSDTLKSELDAKTQEITNLTERLDKSQAQLQELERKMEEEMTAHSAKVAEFESLLATSDKRASELDAELAKSSSAKIVSKKLIDDLNSQIEALKKEKADSQTKLDELTKKPEAQPSSTSSATPTPSSQASNGPNASAGAGSKKKNKKKKGKGGAAAAATAGTGEEEAPEGTEQIPMDSGNSSELEAEITKLRVEVADKDVQIERLSKQRKTEEDLREEIESLQENLVNIGQDHVEAKERIKALETEKAQLKAQIAELEKKVSSSAADSKASTKLQHEMEALQREYEDLREKSNTLQSDLGAAQQLAQTRYKDLTDLRDVLQRAQPELKTLRQESATLKTTKEELAARVKELKEMEKREKDLKREVGRAQQLASDREKEVKGLQDNLTAEKNSRARLEDAQRVSGRDLRRNEAEKIELSSKLEKAERELQRVQEEVSKLRPRVKELEEEMLKLKREKTVAQEEVEFKTQQYSNAQGLLSSMRDQATEMSVQLKESKSQAESLEEELGEVQRLLQERTREGETMRRLLADVDERADNKVREMRGRMEAAIEERDRIEDESSTLARRKTREAEELKVKIRDLEREVKTLANERDELEERQKEWRRRREELEAIEEKAEAETADMLTTVSQLRSALDASESQVRDGERQRLELRKMVDESRQRYEKIAKDLKAAQAKLAPGTADSGRSSVDSSRSGAGGHGSASKPQASEMMYLKTILLQFLEQKDNKLRAQLVPVLGQLLKFDDPPLLRLLPHSWLLVVLQGQPGAFDVMWSQRCLRTRSRALPPVLGQSVPRLLSTAAAATAARPCLSTDKNNNRTTTTPIYSHRRQFSATPSTTMPDNKVFTREHLFDLTGKVALVTGGGSGIGLMAAQALANNGAKVYITGRTQEKLDRAVEAFGKDIRGELIPLQGDIGTKQGVQALYEAFKQREKCLCVLVNNAGISGETQQTETERDPGRELRQNLFETDSATYEDWNQTYSTNVTSQYFVTAAFLPLLQQSTQTHDGWSSTVINITSISGMIKTAQHHFAYNASKGAFQHLTRMMASEFLLSGVRVRINAIAPGVFPSEMTAGDSNDAQKSHIPKEKYEGKVPAARPGKDEDMAGAVLFFATNQYLSGQTLAVDGGYTIQAGL
ncbi:hypothetical protein S7711_01789 [Stachybotrys chartarum IBT 7711]|nr:hypothetical protein S7711_01789 [Stachybotrys chartarum IBT 7711]